MFPFACATPRPKPTPPGPKPHPPGPKPIPGPKPTPYAPRGAEPYPTLFSAGAQTDSWTEAFSLRVALPRPLALALPWPLAAHAARGRGSWSATGLAGCTGTACTHPKAWILCTYVGHAPRARDKRTSVCQDTRLVHRHYSSREPPFSHVLLPDSFSDVLLHVRTYVRTDVRTDVRRSFPPDLAAATEERAVRPRTAPEHRRFPRASLGERCFCTKKRWRAAALRCRA